MTVHDPRGEIGNVPWGWIWLVADLVRDLDELDLDIEVQQVKEKFGGLRFYVTYSLDGAPGASARADALIEQAEEKSLTICKRCGRPGQLRYGGWVRTLCDVCEAGP